MQRLEFDFDPEKRKKYAHFWIYAILSGGSLLFQGIAGELAIAFFIIFALAAIVIPILMAMDERYNLTLHQIKNADTRPDESRPGDR